MAVHVMLKVTETFMTILGIWPVKLTGLKLKFYETYHRIFFGYYLVFIVTFIIKFIQIMGKNFAETAENLGIVIVLLISTWKVRLCTSPQIRTLLQQTEDSEKGIAQNIEKDIRDIYHSHVKLAIKENIAQLTILCTAIFLYSIEPILASRNLETKKLIYVSWMPFDEQVFYFPAYLIQFMAGLYASGYTVATGMCLFSLTIFSRCEIKILQYVFVNFTYYADRHVKDYGGELWEAQRAVLESCIFEHRKIIKFVNTLESTFKTVMLLDFTATSFQFAMVIIQILQKSELDFVAVSRIMYLSTLVLLLYLIYSHAHEIIIESSNISDAIFQSEWYDLPDDVKKTLIIIMIRAQRPLYLSIGPLYQIRCDLLLKILQALYSYCCIFLK